MRRLDRARSSAGRLLKDVPPDELFRAERAGARGEVVLAPAVAARLVRRPPGGALSEREVAALELPARGLVPADIA